MLLLTLFLIFILLAVLGGVTQFVGGALRLAVKGIVPFLVLVLLVCLCSSLS